MSGSEEKNLQDLVYFSVFDKPRYTTEIGDMIYRHNQNQQPLLGKGKAIDRCVDKKAIEKTSIEKPNDVEEYHFKRRNYYIANIDYFLDALEKRIRESGETLEAAERERLKIFVGHPIFREVISTMVFTTDGNGNKVLRDTMKNVDLGTMINLVSFVCSNSYNLLYLYDHDAIGVPANQLKRRLDQLYNNKISDKNHKRDNEDFITSTLRRYLKKINTKISESFFPQLIKKDNIFKELTQGSVSTSSFVNSLQFLGKPLLKKISESSPFDIFVKTMYLEITGAILPYALLEFKYPRLVKKTPTYLEHIKQELEDLDTEVCKYSSHHGLKRKTRQ